jgi:hypothetical protein
LREGLLAELFAERDRHRATMPAETEPSVPSVDKIESKTIDGTGLNGADGYGPGSASTAHFAGHSR